MLSNYIPPNYIKLQDLLTQLRLLYFPDFLSSSLLTLHPETHKTIKHGTLLNPDYLEKQKKEQAEYDKKKTKGEWPLFLNLTEPRYQDRDAIIHTLYEIDIEIEHQMIYLLKNPETTSPGIVLREISIERKLSSSTVSYDAALDVSINYGIVAKRAESTDELRYLLTFYLIDLKIKERLRNLLCHKPAHIQSSGFPESLSSWVLHDKKMIALHEESWIDDDIWYRCLADGRTSLKGNSNPNHISGVGHYDVKDQLVFLEKETIDKYINLLKNMRSNTLNSWEKTGEAIVHEKKLLFFSLQCLDELLKDQPLPTDSDSSESSVSEETPTPIEVKEPEKKQPTLVNLDLHHTPWLELLNHVFEVHGEEGIRTVPKKTLETTIHVYMEENDLPIDSDTDVEYLAKFIRKPEQKSGKRYYDELKKEKKLKKQA